MKFIKSKITRICTICILMILVAASLTETILFRLPFFYEQSTQEKAMTFLVVGLFLLIFVILASKAFIFPFIRRIPKRNNLIFIGCIAILLTLALAVTSAHYWAVPEIHMVEICFNAGNESDNLDIQKLVDPNTNRLYSPDSFGFTRYPITINSGQCVTDRTMNLLSPLTQPLMGFRLTAVVQDDPPEGRFYVTINNVPAVINFEQDTEIQPTSDIVFKDGFEKGKKLDVPWSQYWFVCVKGLGIFLSAIYLSLFLFGLTEQIIAFSPNDTVQPNGIPHGQNKTL